MSNNKQSSVEWFFNQLVANRIIVINGTTYWDKVKLKYEILLEQAKAMHKEEISQAFNDGEYNYFYSRKTGNDFEDGKEYYEEKFGE